jgi:hypothetical protein
MQTGKSSGLISISARQGKAPFLEGVDTPTHLLLSHFNQWISCQEKCEKYDAHS